MSRDISRPKEEVDLVQRRKTQSDNGFTLIELLVTLSVMGVMSALAMTSFASWSVSSDHRSARDETVSALRNAAERALSEGRAYCVHLEAGTMTTYRFACPPGTGAVVVGPSPLDAKRVTLVPSIAAPSGLEGSCPVAGTCAYFYPRGNASSGTISVVRDGRTPYTVTIVGLTSRVYAS